MRVGLVGTGSFALRGVLPAISMAPGIELEAVFNPTFAKAVDAGEQFGARHICKTQVELLALRSVDAVFVVSPPASHRDVVTAVLEAGKPLICDKPVTLGSRDVAILAAIANSRGILNAIDHEWRYEPAMARMANLVRGGSIGMVMMSSLNVITLSARDPAFEAMRYWNFHHSARLGGGMLPQLASHFIDLHLSFFGGLEPMGGYAPAFLTERPTRPAEPGGAPGPMRVVEAEDSAALVGRLPGGGAASLSLSYVGTAMPDLRWVIHGEEGTLLYQGKDGWFGGTLTQAQGWKGEGKAVCVPPRRRELQAPDLNGCMQDLIVELLLDFASVLGGSAKTGRFATLDDEVRVWRAIEHWRST